MIKQIKVLLVSPYSAKKVGGIGTWSKSVLDTFEDNSEVYMMFQNTSFFLKHNAKKQQTALSRLFVGGIDTLLILTKLFFNCIFKRPDVVHYTSSASWALHKDLIAIKIARLFKVPFVIHWHFGRIPEIIEEKGGEYLRLKRVINLATASIVIDKRSYNALMQDGIDENYYIPNALPDNVLQAVGNTESANRLKGVVLFVGQVLRTKGVYELVNSCIKVSRVRQLLIAGPYSESIHDDLKSIANKRDNGEWLQFLGEIPREEVFDYYRKCSVFSLPSYTEGFPYVILEAMAFGCPIIATDVGAIPQLITSETGILIPAKDEGKLTQALNELIDDTPTALKLGEGAREEVVSHYTKDIVMKQYVELWRQVCKTN